jgi:folate-binding protein YgfZ
MSDGLLQNAYHNWMLFTPSFALPEGPAETLQEAAPKPGFCLVPSRAVLEFTGADAPAFLQAQLTADIAKLDARAWRIAGYCSAKGRLLGSGMVWSTGQGIFWLVASDISAALAKRLRMYVLRAKVVVSTPDVAIFGVIGEAAIAAVAGVAEAADVDLLRLSAVLGIERAFAVCRGDGAALKARLAESGVEARPSEVWDWLEVRSGVGFIEAKTQERFVPQMINLEALGGIDFKKGCFPGQEVVARSQYLGKLKRRTLLAHLEGANPPLPGSEVLSLLTQDAVGTVVSAAKAPDGSLDCLIEAPLSAWAEGLVLPEHPQVALEQLVPPYEIPDNEIFVRPRL